MGLPDFEAVFNSLDRTRKGYLSEHDVLLFDESLHFAALSQRQVNAAIEQICGKNSAGIVHKQYFAQLMGELQRRRMLEESLRWDFIGLDSNGSNRITTKDALSLFQIAHGDRFSTSAWNRFLTSRQEPSSDVCFDEILLRLCELPEGQPATSGELKEEQQRLATESNDRVRREYEQHKTRQHQQGESARARERHDAEERTKRLAKRKFARWEHEGLKAMLFDDGLDDGQQVIIKMRTTIGVTELIDVLKTKYDMLRKKLFWEMLKYHSGDVIWTSMSEGEQLEVYQQLEFDEQRARNTGRLAAEAKLLQGGALSHHASLLGIMGDVWTMQTAELNTERMEMRASGMVDVEVELAQERGYRDKVQVATDSSHMLTSLDERFRSEKDSIVSLLHGDRSDERSQQLAISYSRVVRQHDLVKLENSFLLAAIAVGLAERSQDHNPERFEPDRMRQEMLASGRLLAMKAGSEKPSSRFMDESGHNCQGLTELQVAIVHQTTWKYALERDMLMSLLQGRGTTSKVTRMTPSQRSSRLASLRNQRTSWRDSSASYMIAHREIHRKILRDAISLYHEDTRVSLEKRKRVDIGDEGIQAAIIADVQQSQDKEFESILLQISQKTEKQLIHMKKSISDAVLEEHFDNMASVLLGTFEFSNEDRIFILALEEKYEKLRELLLLHSLKMEHNIAWHRLSNEERAKLLSKKRSDELKLRQEGQLSEMDRLLLDMPQDIGTLRDLIGPSRGEMARRYEELYDQQLQQAYMGHDYSKVYIEEAVTGPIASENLLADLVHRLHAEQDALVTQLRRPSASDQHRWLPLVLIRVECERVMKEEHFDVATLGIGLFERLTMESSATDRRRQLQLSAQRCDTRSERTAMGRHYHKQDDDYAWPGKGDIAGWMVSYLREIEKKHTDERELLLSMLQDPSLSDLCDVATCMTESERKTRLFELHGKWQQLDFEIPANQETNVSILEEAAAIQSILTRNMMATKYGGGEGGIGEDGEGVSSEEVAVVLLAKVQDEQDRKMAAVVSSITTLTEEDLKVVRECEIKSRHSATFANLISVLTRYEGAVTNEQLIEALELKYDSIRDKLLIESLISELGEKKWNEMSEAQRQRQLMMLRLEERRLRQQGKYEHLCKLLDASAVDRDRLRHMLAEDKDEHHRKLQEKLALRQKRLQQGMSEEECDRLEAEAAKQEGKRRNILLDLHNCFTQEKEALLRSLDEQSNRIDAERRRQMALVKLRQEQRQSKQEENFTAASLLISGASDYDNLVEAERRRQLDLARERLAVHKLGAKTLTAAEVIALPTDELQHKENGGDPSGVVGKQDGVMREIENRHACERQLLLAVFDDPMLGAYRKQTADLDPHLKVEALSRLHNTQQQWQHATKVEQKDKLHLFLEAAALRLEIMSEDLKREGQSSSGNDIQVALLAQLQDCQCREAAVIMESLIDMDADALQKVRAEQTTLQQQQTYDGLSAVLLGTQQQQIVSSGERQLVDALEEKYDALRDKLLIEALMRGMSETEWERLTEKQRQTKLVELKREEKRLRMAGRYDDAAALLGQHMLDDKALADMLGKSASDQIRRQEAHCRRRRELVAKRERAGLSVDDAILDAIQNEEEEIADKAKKRMQEKLAERRKARRDAERERSARRSTPEDGSSGNLSLGSLKRERTIVDIDLSESDKEALYQQLISQQAALNKKLTADHKKHEEQVQERLDRMRKRRCSEAADLMMLAERQRSHLEKAVKEERDRHAMMTKERVARMRYEKTLTMKTASGGAVGGREQRFQDVTLADDTSQMSEDDKMELAARRMQQRFEQQEKGIAPPNRTSSATLGVISEMGSDEERMSEAVRNKPKDAMQILKERRALKKQQKMEENL